MNVKTAVGMAALMSVLACRPSSPADGSGERNTSRSEPAEVATRRVNSGVLTRISTTYNGAGCRIYRDQSQQEILGEFDAENTDTSTSRVHTYWRIGVRGSVQEDFFIRQPDRFVDLSSGSEPRMELGSFERLPSDLCRMRGCTAYSGWGRLTTTTANSQSVVDDVFLSCVSQ